MEVKEAEEVKEVKDEGGIRKWRKEKRRGAEHRDTEGAEKRKRGNLEPRGRKSPALQNKGGGPSRLGVRAA
jgi:hypothetical protein